MDYKGEWGGGGPGHSWALKWHLFYCVQNGEDFESMVQGMVQETTLQSQLAQQVISHCTS